MRVGAFMIVSLALAAPALAQSWPTKPIRLVVPNPPGGPNDFLSRTLANDMGPRLGQPIIVENRPGANAIIGTEYVAKQPPDGYTIIQSSASLVLNANFPPKKPFDPIRDFAPIGRAVSTTFMLTVSPKVEARNMKDFIALARANPGRLTYATVGYGSPHHLAGELFQYLTGTKLLQVNYKGGAQITQSLMSGEVDSTFISIFPVRKLVQSGKLFGLGVTTKYRSPLLPDVPTIAEAVPLPDYELNIWQGLLAPAGTPQPVIERLNREMNATLKDPKIFASLTEAGLDPTGTSPGEFAAILKRDMDTWARLVKEANIRVE